MSSSLRSVSDIEHKIYIIRSQRIMIDRDLAELYDVETKALNQAVKRNIERFPEDFMFKLTEEESAALSMRYQFGTASDEHLRSQFVTANDKFVIDKPILKSQIVTSRLHGGRRKLPYAFTEQGVSMLSSVLKSKQAVQVNIQIMRTFTKIREMLATNKGLREKIEKLEEKYDQQFTVVFTAIKRLINPPEKPKSSIGFRTDNL